MANDSEDFNIDYNHQTFINDLYFNIIKNDWEDEKIKALKYYLIMLNIIWLIDFK